MAAVLLLSSVLLALFEEYDNEVVAELVAEAEMVAEEVEGEEEEDLLLLEEEDDDADEGTCMCAKYFVCGYVQVRKCATVSLWVCKL